mgnify:FL=1
MRKTAATVTIDTALLERLTMDAEKRRISRSALLTMIINRYYNEKDRRAKRMEAEHE